MINRMAVPLEAHKPLGGRQNASLKQKLEKYFALIGYLALLTVSVGVALYGKFAYRNEIRLVVVLAYVAFMVTRLVRHIPCAASNALKLCDGHSHIVLLASCVFLVNSRSSGNRTLI